MRQGQGNLPLACPPHIHQPRHANNERIDVYISKQPITRQEVPAPQCSTHNQMPAHTTRVGQAGFTACLPCASLAASRAN